VVDSGRRRAIAHSHFSLRDARRACASGKMGASPVFFSMESVHHGRFRKSPLDLLNQGPRVLWNLSIAPFIDTCTITRYFKNMPVQHTEYAPELHPGANTWETICGREKYAIGNYLQNKAPPDEGNIAY